MGMFDYVNFKTVCPKCGAEVTEFQSKDRDCVMETLEISDVDTLHAICGECNTYLNYVVEKECIVKDVKLIETVVLSDKVKNHGLQRDNESD